MNEAIQESLVRFCLTIWFMPYATKICLFVNGIDLFQAQPFQDINQQREVKWLLIAETPVANKLLHVYIFLYLLYRLLIAQVTLCLIIFAPKATLGLIPPTPFPLVAHLGLIGNYQVPPWNLVC
jgi:hypothetical protein